MKLHVETLGHGEPLVLIHGWGMHGGVWAPLLAPLSERYQLHIIDLPGMGFSPAMPSAHAFTLHTLAECLLHVIPDASHVLGWSFGGLVAMTLANQYPERVRKLMLVASTPKFVNAEDWQNGMDGQVFRQFAAQMAQQYQTTLHKFLSLQCLGSSQARDTLRSLKASFALRPEPATETLQQALDVLLEADLRAAIPALHLPVLLLHGTRDTLVPPEAASWMQQMLPSSKLTLFKGAGHAPFLSDTASFIAALDDFLQPAKQPSIPL